MSRHEGTDHITADRIAITIGLALIAASILILLSGCSTVRPYAEKGLESAQNVNDGFLESMEIGYCDGPTDGALTRRYGGDSEIQSLRNDLCRVIRDKHYAR